MKHQWKFEEYSLWSRQIAQNYSIEEIEKEVGVTNSKRSSLSKNHLNALSKTTSMSSQSQRRAQTRNSMAGNYERFKAYSDALELHELYPSKCKNKLG